MSMDTLKVGDPYTFIIKGENLVGSRVGDEFDRKGRLFRITKMHADAVETIYLGPDDECQE